MKVLVVGPYGTLSVLHDQAFKDKTVQCVDKNSLLFSADSKEAWSNIPDSEFQICFGYYYTDLPPEDPRFQGKVGWFDVLVEIGSNKMGFLNPDKHVCLDHCKSVTQIVKAVKNVETEEG